MFKQVTGGLLLCAGLASVGFAKAPKPAKKETKTAASSSIQGQLSGNPSVNNAASPLAVRIGDTTFTPGGFMDFTSVFRTTNVGSGIGTNFGGIPFTNSTAGNLSELRFSAQNSRLALKVDGHKDDFNFTAYTEADFLGAGPANLDVTSNANTFRMRLYWLQVSRGNLQVLAGQSWSLMTPNRTGISPMPGDIFFSQDMDTNYQVGLTWARQAQFRVVDKINHNWTAAVSVENPQQYITGSVVLPTTGSGPSPYASQFDNGSNSGAPNLTPDFIGKLAFDTKVGGHAFHVEGVGLGRSFRDYNPGTGVKNTIWGGGVSLNANLELVKNFHAILNTYYSDGGGRYIFGLGPDVIVKADGTLSAVHSSSGIAGFEWAKGSNMIYGYYGGAYFARNYGFSGATQIGFGAPASNAANRAIQEGTFGINHTFWKSDNYGAVMMITQYSYVTRSLWAGNPSKAKSSMAWLDIRYVLP